MVALTIPYIVPLFLGMTFDARTSKPGVSIFDSNVISQAVSTPIGSTSTTYKVVTEKKEIRDQLDISGDLALKIKTGNIDVKGTGSYLKNEEDTKNSVIILSTFRHIARAVSLPANAKPRGTWLTDFDKEVLGTHYAETITYGVEMVAAVKFSASNKEDLKNIKAKVEGTFGSDNQTWTAEAAGELSNVVSSLKDSSTLEITFFGTLPLNTIPNTIDGLKELIKNFGDLVKQAGLEDGLPMTVTLQDLNSIDEAKNEKDLEYNPDTNVQNKYEKFVTAFDDLVTHRNQLFSWTRSLPFDLNEEDSSTIGRLLEKLNEKLNKCYELMAKTDLEKDENQFDSILGERLSTLFDDIEDTMSDIDKKVNKELHVASATYVHWGNTSCQANKKDPAELLFDGYAVGSKMEGIGGFVRYDCMPTKDIASPYKLSDEAYKSLITGIHYGSLSSARNKLFKGPHVRKINDGKIVPCAKCHQLDASAVSMFPATTKCPPQWDIRYRGYLMSPATGASLSAQYICVDEYPTDPAQIKGAVSDAESAIDLTVVHNEKSLPLVFAENEIVPCAVCALKGGRIL